MNDTIFDNLSTRRLKLNFKKEDDFYSVDDLNKLDIYKKYKDFINKIPLKKDFITDKYIDDILNSQRWSNHGGDLSAFIEDHIHYDEFPEELKTYAGKIQEDNILDTICQNDEFRDYFKNWFHKRYDYVVNEILLEIDGFPLTVHREMYANKEEINDILSGEKKDYGVYWGTGNVSAWSANDTEGKESITLTAIIKDSDVNWKKTLISRFDYENGDAESEIQIKEGVIPKLTDVYSDENGLLSLKKMNNKKLKP
jgi:hypothetical protein